MKNKVYEEYALNAEMVFTEDFEKFYIENEDSESCKDCTTIANDYIAYIRTDILEGVLDTEIRRFMKAFLGVKNITDIHLVNRYEDYIRKILLDYMLS